jgi:hypothetical protein
MPIAEIIKEIDAYLSRLQRARDLLLAPMMEPQPKRMHRHKRKINIGRKSAPAFSSRSELHANRSRAKRAASQGNRAKKLTSVPPVRRSAVRKAARPEQSQSAAIESAVQSTVTPPQIVNKEVPASKRQIPSTRSARRTTATPAIRTKLKETKPAIALAGPMTSKIVVVSAEQARQERERATQPQVRRPRPPSTGLSGKLAFEALFNDAPDPSKDFQ